MLRLWWNLVFMCKIGRETRFCQYFCTFFSILRENRDIFFWKNDFFRFGHVHSIWIWSYNFSAKTNPNGVLKSLEYFKQNNGSGFFKFILEFFTMTKNVSEHWKALIFFNEPHFSVYYWIYGKNKDENQKSRAGVL